MATQHTYIGNGKAGKFGMKLQLDLTQLFAFTKTEEGKKLLKKWTDKSGVEHTAINLEVNEMKDEHKSEFRTHSIRIDKFVPEKKVEFEKTKAQQEDDLSDLPF